MLHVLHRRYSCMRHARRLCHLCSVGQHPSMETRTALAGSLLRAAVALINLDGDLRAPPRSTRA